MKFNEMTFSAAQDNSAQSQQDSTQSSLSPFEVDDLFLHKKVLKIACSPDGKHIAAAIQSAESQQDGYLSCIWEYHLDKAECRQLTFGPGRDASPEWSPDGQTLAFISDRNGGEKQLFLLPRLGGEAQQITSVPGTLQSFRWAVDGSRLIVAAAVGVDPDDKGQSTPLEPVVRAANAPEVAWRLPYKADGVGYLLGRQIHLFNVAFPSGTVARITQGDFDVLSFAPSTDGKKLTYVRTRAGLLAHASDLWVCEMEGGGHEQLTDSHSLVMSPCWSPNGNSIAFTGAVMDGDAQLRPWVLDLAQRAARQLCDADVADAESLYWDSEDRVTFVSAFEGRHRIVRACASSGTLTSLLDLEAQIGAFDASLTHFVYAIDHPSRPSELHVADAQGDNERTLSCLNAWWWKRYPVNAEQRTFTVPNGLGGSETIHGWLLSSQDEARALAGPLLCDVHGGPASYALLDFESHVYWQVLCSRGWRVLALNPVGSSSFGREFCRRLAGHWGVYDLPQHLAAIDQLQEEGLCDTRLAMAGKSYGGYMTGWAAGHSDRFQAAVVMAPVGNIETHFGTSDGGYYADAYNLGSVPRFDWEKARQLSPVHAIGKTATPTLFLQGKDDERCARGQSEELFVRMMEAGKAPAELVLYPGEGHSFLATGKPSCRSDASKRIVRWLEKQLMGKLDGA